MANRHRYQLKAFAIAFLGGGCCLCGYSKCQRGLDFHHLADKAFSFGGKHCSSWERLKGELQKCVLLCRNCHAEAHEAQDEIIWGRPDPGILARIAEAHAGFIPDPTAEYHREGWEAFHPAYKGKGLTHPKGKSVRYAERWTVTEPPKKTIPILGKIS